MCYSGSDKKLKLMAEKVLTRALCRACILGIENMKTSHLPVVFGLILAAPMVVHAQEAAPTEPLSSADPVMTECIVEPAKDLRVSASEAGLLIKLDVEEGSRVEEDAELGHVDDQQAQMQKTAAKYGMAQAKKQAEDDIDVRYATKAHKVAEKEYELNQDLDRKRKGAVPFVELERLRLDAERAALAIEKAGNDRELAKFDYWTKRTEFEAAEKAIERRNILAPTKGEVVKLFRQQGEWVNPGDPILRLVRLDTLYVEGEVDVKKFEPSQILGCRVTVDVAAGGGRSEKAEGKIVWVNPVAVWRGGDDYYWKVRAEVTNELTGGNWKIHPGVQATMTIHLDTAEKVLLSDRVK